MTFLWLQSIDTQHHIVHVMIDFCQPLRILFTSRHNRLIPGDHIFDRIVRDSNLIAVLQFTPDLRNRPMP